MSLARNTIDAHIIHITPYQFLLKDLEQKYNLNNFNPIELTIAFDYGIDKDFHAVYRFIKSRYFSISCKTTFFIFIVYILFSIKHILIFDLELADSV